MAFPLSFEAWVDVRQVGRGGCITRTKTCEWLQVRDTEDTLVSRYAGLQVLWQVELVKIVVGDETRNIN